MLSSEIIPTKHYTSGEYKFETHMIVLTFTTKQANLQAIVSLQSGKI